MLGLLRAAARYGKRTDRVSFPQDILSFTIDYGPAPDVAAARARLEALLGADGFDLFAYSEVDDPSLLVLQFPGVARAQSPDYLFHAAQDLRDALDAVSVTPDIDPPFRDVETAAPGTEGVGDALWSLCRSSEPSVGRSGWAGELMRVPQARERFGVSGAGVLVAQPDTGVAPHDELRSGIDMGLGYNFVDGSDDPTDPLRPSMRSPGHGVSTSSLVVSRADGIVAGTAPGATLVPFRAIDSVIIGSGVGVARAIDAARAAGCHVVTMSLGGPLAGPALSRAIERAVAADMIVLSAAGNCVRFVTFPAWRDDVIAVAGIDHRGRPWRGSCRGPEVDVSAPGENVFVARRHVQPEGTEPTPADLALVDELGQGTSFAVALTAGVAALWLERFGRAAVVAEARRRRTTVQALFRSALTSSARAPEGWDGARMGAGIVDAEALLALPLGAVPDAQGPETQGPETQGPETQEPETPRPETPRPAAAGPAVALFGRDFRGTPFEAEASYVAWDWRLREEGGAGALETAVAARPSPQFAAAIDRAPPDLAAPAAIVTPAAPPVPIETALRRLGACRTQGLESAAAIDEDTAKARIRAEGTEAIVATAERRFAERRARAPDKVDRGAQALATERMHEALRAVTAGDDPAPVTGEVRAALEALIMLTGRPAIRVRGDDSELMDPMLGDWQADIVPTRHLWRPLTDAVGRIDYRTERGWIHAGTGFVVADGRVMTNRHVIDTFAEPLPSGPGEQAFALVHEASIVFDPDARDERTRFPLTRVVTAGRNRIGGFVNLANLDMAVLAMETGDGAPPPIDRTLASAEEPGVTKILVAGYPAAPSGQQAPHDADPQTFLAFWDRIRELYGEDYGVKYMSPGQIMARTGTLPGDDRAWAFTHDATTLPGNSGSAIISLFGRMGFCGLHFGGSTLSMNLAHDIAAVARGGDGVFDPSVLKAG